MEIWLDVESYKGYLQVSSEGRVRSLDRVATDGKRLKGKILTPSMSSSGYLSIRASVGSKLKTLNLHRLVAEAFIPRELGKPIVNHINHKPTDNRLENLEWESYSGNAKKALAFGVWKNIGEDNHRSKLKEVTVKEVRNLVKLGASLRIVSSLFDIKYQTLVDIIARKTWVHV